jgi:polyisoprenoid-binding protein YceI
MKRKGIMVQTVTATAAEKAVGTAAAVRSYQIDKAHSEVTLQVRHLLTKVRGHFGDFSGVVTIDEMSPANSTVDVTIQAASIDTHTPDRDNHLRSADFFDVENYPALTFKSVSVAPRGSGWFDVVGDLTIHGVTRQITLPVNYLGNGKDPWGNEKAAFEADITINRKDFNLNWNATLETGGFLVGDDVKISLSIQALAQ